MAENLTVDPGKRKVHAPPEHYDLGQVDNYREIKDNTGHQQMMSSSPFDAALGFVSDIMDMHYQNYVREDAKKENRRAADVAYARQKELMSEQERYNSVQNEVAMLKQAGLNPALAYGSLSSAQVSQPSAPMESPSPVNSSNFGVKTMQGLQTGLNAELTAAQVENMRQNTASQYEDTFTKHAQNAVMYSKVQLDLLKQLEEINKLKSSAALDQAQKDNLTNTYNMMLEYYKKLGEKMDSDISFSAIQGEFVKAQTVTEESKPGLIQSETSLNNAKVKTEGTQQNLNDELANTESVKRILMSSEKALNRVKTNEIRLKYNIDNEQYKVIKKWAQEHGLQGYEKTILTAVGEGVGSMSNQLPKTILSWLDAGNWLHYLGMKSFQKDSNVIPPEGSDDSPIPTGKNKDVARAVPSDKSFEDHVIKQINPRLNDEQRDMFNKGYKWLSPQLDERHRNEFKKDLYYTDDPDEFMDKFLEWYYHYKYSSGSKFNLD